MGMSYAGVAGSSDYAPLVQFLRSFKLCFRRVPSSLDGFTTRAGRVHQGSGGISLGGRVAGGAGRGGPEGL